MKPQKKQKKLSCPTNEINSFTWIRTKNKTRKDNKVLYLESRLIMSSDCNSKSPVGVPQGSANRPRSTYGWRASAEGGVSIAGITSHWEGGGLL